MSVESRNGKVSRGELVALFQGLRVTDVSDSLDVHGFQDVGLMTWKIRPLWRDTDTFKHRIYGFAYTLRLKPATRRMPSSPPQVVEDAMTEWNRSGPRPIGEDLQAGDIVVVDAAGIGDNGFVGSNNAMGWLARGACGVVTGGGCRDTDELIKEQVPVYSRRIARGIRPGRMEIEGPQQPVTVGGVWVRPGDFVVADGDGVAVVPIEVAADVARRAREIANDDKVGRSRIYERLGKSPDFTLDQLR